LKHTSERGTLGTRKLAHSILIIRIIMRRRAHWCRYKAAVVKDNVFYFVNELFMSGEER